MNKSIFYQILGFSLFSVIALGQTGSNSMSTSPGSAKKVKNFEMVTLADYSSNMYREGTAEKESSLDWTFLPSYRFNDHFSIGAKAVISQQQTGPRDTLASDSILNLNYKSDPYFNKTTNFIQILSGIIPTSEKSQKTDRLRGGARVGTGFLTTMNSVQLKYVIALQRNFHEYTVNAEDSPNIEYSLRQALEFSYGITEKFLFLFSGLFNNGRTYAGYERSSFLSDVGFEYDFNKNFLVAVGLSNEGPALKANGTDSNVQLYDDKTSNIHVGVGIIF